MRRDLDPRLAGGLVVEPCDAEVFASVRVAAVCPVLESIGGGVEVLNEVVEPTAGTGRGQFEKPTSSTTRP
jgi:hypothetical protein